MLNVNPRWLRDWVTADLIPHQRKGAVRGVWFTYANVVEIGRMLPSLMSARQATSRAQRRRDLASPAACTIARATAVTDEMVERFTGLQSLRANA